jgi:hypothetical protein
MRLAGKIFSFIFAVIAIPLFGLAACNVAVKSSVLNRGTYEGILQNEAIFEEFLTVSLPAIFHVGGEDTVEFQESDDSPVQLQEIVHVLQGKPEVFEEFAALLVPPEWLQSTVTQLVNAAFDLSEGNLDVLDNEISLAEIRGRFTGEEAVQAAVLLISEAPPCSASQLEQLNTFISSGDGKVPICNPDDEALQSQMVDFISAWFGAVAEQMPAENVTISTLFKIDRDDARAFYLFADLNQKSMLLVYLCPAAFVSLIVIFTVRSRRGFGLWLGTVAVFTGFAILLEIFMLQVVAFNIVSEALQADDEVGQFFARVFSELVSSAFGEGSANLFVQAAIFIALGFILLVLAWLSRRGGDAKDGEMVLITDDGQIISTASHRRIGSIEPQDKAG